MIVQGRAYLFCYDEPADRLRLVKAGSPRGDTRDILIPWTMQRNRIFQLSRLDVELVYIASGSRAV